MRKIKFRFWDPFNQIMIFCSEEYQDYLSKFFIEYDSAIQGENNPLLMQFSGLKDKNGTDVYEGDIIRSEFLNGYWYVTFKEGNFGLIKSEDDNPFLMGACNQDGATEIVGNIYQNKDFQFIDFPKRRKNAKVKNK